MRRSAFYARISTDEKGQKYSLATQVDTMTSYCKERYGDGWLLYNLYVDERSGKDVDRPGLQDMLHDARTTEFDELLVMSVDRLARNARDLMSILDALSTRGIAFRSVTEPFDSSGPAGRMMLQALGSFAEFEHNAVSERVRVSMLRKARAGRYPGNKAPYGFRIAGSNGLVVDRDEAAVVASVFDMYVRERMGSTAIARALNREGIRSRFGRDWRSSVVRRMLRNPTYVGKMRWAGVRRGLHEPIVAEDTFREAANIMEQQAEMRRARRPRRAHRYLLTGILRCGRCGSLMRAFGEHGKPYFYYACQGKLWSEKCDQENIRGDLLDRSLAEEIRALFHDQDLLGQVHDVAKDMLAPGTCVIERELAELESATRRIATSLAEARVGFEKGEVPAAICSARARQLRRERSRLAQKRSPLRRALAARNIAEVDHVAPAAAVERLDEALAGDDGRLKKLRLRTVVAEIVVSGRESVDISYRVPGPGELPATQEKRVQSRTERPEMRFAIRYRHPSRHCLRQAATVSIHMGGSPGRTLTRSVEITRADAPRIDPAAIFRRGCTSRERR